MLLQKSIDRHDETRSAETALHAMTFPECLLYRVQFAVVRQSLNRRDVFAICLYGKHQAGADSFSTDQDGTRSADAVLTSKVRPGEFHVVAQEVGQRLTRLYASFTGNSVDSECHDMFLTRAHCFISFNRTNAFTVHAAQLRCGCVPRACGRGRSCAP